MHGDQQRVFVLTQLNQAAADQWSCRQIKTAVCFFPDYLVQQFLTAQVVLDQVKATVSGCGDALPRLAFNGHKRGAQRLVTSDDAIQRLPQCCAVKLSFYPPTVGD